MKASPAPISRSFLLAISPLLLVTSLAAQDRQPADGAPRGERPAGGERTPGAGGARAEFPAELKLTEDQQAKLKEIGAGFGAKQAELFKKREGILSDEQKAAQAEAMKKLRESGATRQEASDQLSAALKLTPEQRTQIEELDGSIRQVAQEANAEKTAVLSDEQRTALRKLTLANGVARSFNLPGGIAATDEQKASLKALQEELGPKLAEAAEKQALLLTDERRAAREAAFKQARESGQDRQATAAAVDAALKMSDAEKAEMTANEQSLREVSEQIRTRITALLTPEQKAELEKRGGATR